MFRSRSPTMSEPLSSREGKLTLLAILMMLYVLALFLSIAIHELLGHGLFATLLGGDVYAFYLSPGSGFVSFWLPEGISASNVALIYMAGILVQLVLGSAVLFFVVPRIKNFMLGMFTLMFCIGMTVLSSLYLVMGYVYESGDTRYAAAVLGMQPDPFVAAGLVLTGIFIIAVSVAALKFIGRFMDLEDDRVRMGMLAVFWFPPLLLSGFISLFFSLSLPQDQMTYPFLNSVVLMLFLGMALILVPMMVEPKRESEHRITFSSIVSIVACFMLVMAGWAGVFGLSQETARGVLLHDPPVEVESYYLDYSIGNAAVHVHANGTMRVDIVLRNIMESPSPLESKIYHSFDTRPDWDRYIARSKNILMTMFSLPRGATDNRSFATSLVNVRAAGSNDTNGRMCTTYLSVPDGTRQSHLSPGGPTPQPGMGILDGDYTLTFVDPWSNQGGYMDMVTISWDAEMVLVELLAWSILDPSFDPVAIDESTYVWENNSTEGSPTNYRLILDIG